MDDEIVVGIDLGTTNSCVAYYLNGAVKIINNSEGERSTPSCVYYSERNEVVVGKYAQKFAERNNKPENQIYGAKRLIGQKFDDIEVQRSLPNLGYKVESDKNRPIIVLGLLRKTPIEVTVALLTKIKTDIERALGKKEVIKAVVTVPAYFNSIQKKATSEATRRAGFKVLKLLNEPTAAALKFFFDKPNYAVGDHFLVFDFGGGTCDVAILKKCEETVEIVAIDGNNHLGGHDIDNVIINYVVKKISEKYQTTIGNRDLRRIHKMCEEAKKTLSDLESTEISLDALYNELKEVQITLSREDLNSMCTDLFDKSVALIDSCLKSGKVAKQDIKEIILAGGSSRIPKISKMISDYFDGRELNRFVNADECVAEGAALQAAMLSKHPNQQISSINIIDITPLSLGVTLFSTLMHVLIKRHSKIPISVKEKYCTILDNQKTIDIKVYEGERADATKNRHLGTFSLTNLTQAPARQCQIFVEMSIDMNGILTITATEQLNNNINKLEIVNVHDQQSDANVQNTIMDAERHRKDDEHFLKVIHLQRTLIHHCQSIKSSLEKKGFTKKEKEIYDWCAETILKAAQLKTNQEVEIHHLISLADVKRKNLITKYKTGNGDQSSKVNKVHFAKNEDKI